MIKEASWPKGKKKAGLVIGLILGVILIITLVIFGINKLSTYAEEKKLCDAAHAGIEEAMAAHDLADYEVVDVYTSLGGSIYIVCESFEDLSNKEKVDLIKDIEKLDSIELEGEEIDFNSCFFYTSKEDYKNNKDYYFYVNPVVLGHEGQVDCGGLYIASNDSGMTCLYPEY